MIESRQAPRASDPSSRRPLPSDVTSPQHHSMCHFRDCQESGSQPTHMVVIYNFLGLECGPNVTFAANFLLIRCCSSSAKRIMSQTGVLRFKNATDCGAKTSWVGGEGQGASLGNGEGEKTDSAEGCFCNRETVTCRPYGDFSRHSAKTASNT